MPPIPLRFQAPCHFCGDTVDIRKKAGNYELEQGWAQHRTQGGTNALALTQSMGLYACHFCIDKQRKGHVHYQLNLFA